MADVTKNFPSDAGVLVGSVNGVNFPSGEGLSAGSVITVDMPVTSLHVIASATITPFLYVCDSGNNRISVSDYDGNFLFTWGSFGSGNGQFNNPFGVCNDGSKVYVTDTGNNRVQIFDLYGNYLGQFGAFGSDPGQFYSPKGIATDGVFLYVIDQANNRFQIFTLSGFFIMSIGVFGNGINQFNSPTNIYVDQYYIYIDDTGNSRIVIYEKNLSTDWVASVSLPMKTVSGTFYGHWWEGSVERPMFTVSGTMSANGVFEGSVSRPMFTVSGEFSAVQYFNGSVSRPMLTVSGTFDAEVSFTADITLPMRTVSGEFTARGVFSADLMRPMFVVSGVLSQVLAEVYHAIAVNTELSAVTEYTNYAFNSMCEFNGKYYASGASGVVRLDGATDLGQTIVPVARFGTNDLHSGVVKSFEDSYFTGKANSQTVVKVIYDEDEITPVNTFETDVPNTTGSRAVRVKVPQGMKKKRFVAVEIRGADEIDNHRLIIEPIPGRVR